MQELIESGEGLPPEVDLKGRFIYYVGPVDPVRDEVVGPAGPTTSTRMDKFTDFILGETGLLGMIGQGRARSHWRGGDQEAQGGLPDGGGWRCLPGIQGDNLG